MALQRMADNSHLIMGQPDNPLRSDLEAVLQRTPDVWEELRGQRVFVTGGTGFIGTWLLESFCWANKRLALGAQAFVLTRSPQNYLLKVPHLANDPAVTLMPGDVRTFEFPEGTFSHVIHAATDVAAGAQFQNHRLQLDTIVRGTERTLEFADQARAKKVLFTSSGGVYGNQPLELLHVTEDYQGAPAPCHVDSTYGEGKRAAELLCAIFVQQGLPVKIARCFTFVGPYLPVDGRYAVGNFVGAAAGNQEIFVRGNPMTVRSYLYTADMAVWLWSILIRGQAGRPYNVGSNRAVTMKVLADTVARQFVPQPKVRVRQDWEAVPPASRYVPSTERAVEELGLVQTVDLDEALEKYVRFTTRV